MSIISHHVYGLELRKTFEFILNYAILVNGLVDILWTYQGAKIIMMILDLFMFIWLPVKNMQKWYIIIIIIIFWTCY